VAVATDRARIPPPCDEIFSSFEREPVASASIAQVHFATLKGP
jgi:ubiquinone biosynthesis protein